MRLSIAVGLRVAQLLEQNKISQYKLCKEGGIPRSTISVIVSGKNKTIKLDTIQQIVSTLGLTLKDFFDDAIFEEIDD